jgi:DNA replicative helicase MCM subunit Mcm2 (Cdc46/Mcm family)
MDEAAYVCDACGEEIVIPIDPSAGEVQTFVEDCPVCCHPNVVTVTLQADGSIDCRAEPE